MRSSFRIVEVFLKKDFYQPAKLEVLCFSGDEAERFSSFKRTVNIVMTAKSVGWDTLFALLTIVEVAVTWHQRERTEPASKISPVLGGDKGSGLETNGSE